jgi:hypothetical protein
MIGLITVHASVLHEAGKELKLYCIKIGILIFSCNVQRKIWVFKTYI